MCLSTHNAAQFLNFIGFLLLGAAKMNHMRLKLSGLQVLPRIYIAAVAYDGVSLLVEIEMLGRS